MESSFSTALLRGEGFALKCLTLRGVNEKNAVSEPEINADKQSNITTRTTFQILSGVKLLNVIWEKQSSANSKTI